MLLKRKIVVGFSTSAFIIAALSVFVYLNTVKIREVIRFLEATDSLRSKALELRRHEKNFFLYREKAADEAAAIDEYLLTMQEMTPVIRYAEPEGAGEVDTLLANYRRTFDRIKVYIESIGNELDSLKEHNPSQEAIFPILRGSIYDNPKQSAAIISRIFLLPEDSPIVDDLQGLNSAISSLRKAGENIIVVSNELDRKARNRAERGIHVSQNAIIVAFPMFLFTGLVVLFVISSDIVRRVRMLTASVEEVIGRYLVHGISTAYMGTGAADEIGMLDEKFRRMEWQLATWESELEHKNSELLQSKKLAAIGTLASGVAHELNNPLNNIYLSAQVLKRRTSGTPGPDVAETVDDILGQTVRVKGIVSDLLEFARERAPQLADVDLGELVHTSYALMSRTVSVKGVNLTVEAPDEPMHVMADRDQLERVFINLFSNSVAAMPRGGDLRVTIESIDGIVEIKVLDTGRGMSSEDREKIFDPFFTKKASGTGLGLAIVLNIVRKHGGTINVTSQEGQGTVFEITLPQKGTHDEL